MQTTPTKRQQRDRRTRSSAKKAGSSFERLVADFLRETLSDDRIDRRVKRGSDDRGDIHGVRTTGGGRVVVECKDYGGRLLAGPWLSEAEVERGNDDAVTSAVVAKRRGTRAPGEQIVLMTLTDFVLLLEGGVSR